MIYLLDVNVLIALGDCTPLTGVLSSSFLKCATL